MGEEVLRRPRVPEKGECATETIRHESGCVKILVQICTRHEYHDCGTLE